MFLKRLLIKGGIFMTIEEIYADYYDVLLFYGISLSGSIETAEDLVQEAIYRFLLVTEPVDNIKAWLMAVMRNYYFDSLRKKKAEVPLKITNEPCHYGIEEKLFNDERQLKIYRSLQKIREPYQTVLLLRYFLEMPLTQVAELQKLKYGQCKTILYRAKKMLKEELEKDEFFTG